MSATFGFFCSSFARAASKVNEMKEVTNHMDSCLDEGLLGLHEMNEIYLYRRL